MKYILEIPSGCDAPPFYVEVIAKTKYAAMTKIYKSHPELKEYDDAYIYLNVKERLGEVENEQRTSN